MKNVHRHRKLESLTSINDVSQCAVCGTKQKYSTVAKKEIGVDERAEEVLYAEGRDIALIFGGIQKHSVNCDGREAIIDVDYEIYSNIMYVSAKIFKD